MSDLERRLRQARQAADAGKLNQARSILQRLEREAPGSADVASEMGHLLVRQRRWSEATVYLRRAATISANRYVLRDLAMSLMETGDVDGALEFCRRALAFEPEDHEMIQLEVAAMMRHQDFLTLREKLPQLISRFPQVEQLRQAYVDVLVRTARAEEAIAVAKRAQFDFPSSVKLAELACFSLANALNADRRTVFEAHVNAGRLISQLAPGDRFRHNRAAGDGRAIRVAIISPDMRRHSVACFLRPIVEHVDRLRVFLTLYHTGHHCDEVSDILRSNAGAWRADLPLTVREAAEEIHRDGHDILIELSGLTGNSVLPVMALRPAPIQVTYCGYPNTTGLSEIDYRIVDSITDPSDAGEDAQAYATERLVRLDPCFLCYTPYPDTKPPDPNARRLLQNRPLVFGCFGSIFKYNKTTFRMWQRVLDGCPGARLVLKNLQLESEQARRAVRVELESAGCDLARIDLLVPQANTRDHVAAYSEIDIALDTFPYSGTTTTCEALSMGVPVVTLLGRSHASRVGASLLNQAGLGQWVTETPEQFIEVATRLAADRTDLDLIHHRLPDQFARSALCDGRTFARRFEDTLLRLASVPK